MKNVAVRALILLSIYAWLLISLVTHRNWEIAYEGKFWAETVFLNYGRMRYNPDSPVHIIVGYDSENCVIEAPSRDNMLSLMNITVSAPNAPYAILIGSDTNKLSLEGTIKIGE